MTKNADAKIIKIEPLSYTSEAPFFEKMVKEAQRDSLRGQKCGVTTSDNLHKGDTTFFFNSICKYNSEIVNNNAKIMRSNVLCVGESSRAKIKNEA